MVACLLTGRADERPRKEVRTFRTVTQDLLALREWLQQEGCTQVAMESTGVSWKPVYAILEPPASDAAPTFRLAPSSPSGPAVLPVHHFRKEPTRR